MKKTLLSLVFTISSLTSFAQTGIWATVENISNLQKDSTFQSLNLEVTQAFPSSRNPLLQNVYEFTTNNNIVSVSNILGNIKGISKIEFAPEYETLSLPNDISSTGYNYALDLINASAAWDITTGDSAIAIGISDSNFDLDHEELIHKSLYVSPNIYGTDYNHGTAVATIASGNTNNAVGNSSIGYNTHLKFFGMSYNELLTATYNGCRVINASWAAGCTYNQYGQAVIDEVYANGSIVVVAAGNGSTCGGANNLVYPAAYNHVISVSSVGMNDLHERVYGDVNSTHQHNSEVDICAPGYGVAVALANNIYTVGSGTSFAAPYVSGTIALMLSANPCLTFEAVEAILDSTAADIYPINPSYVGLLGSGRLNAGAAVNLAVQWVMNVEFNTQNVLCNGMNNGSIESIVTGGVLPYSYEWNTGYLGKDLNNVTAGVYSLTVTDGSGCMQTVSTEITEPEVLEAAVKGINNWIDLAVAGGTPGYTFEWNNGSITEDLTNIEDGFYEVLVTDANGCMVSTNITFENEQLSVNENIIDELNVYPNPSTGNVTIEFNDNIKEIKVISITGQVIKIGSSTTALTNLNAGEYFIYYTNGVDTKVNKFTVM